MIIKADLVFSNMSGEGILRRSSWKAEAIRRGDLKISGPIPITEDTPLSEEEEREYAEKHNISSPVSPSDTASQQPQQLQPLASQPQPSTTGSLHTMSDRHEQPPQQAEDHHEAEVGKSLGGVRGISEQPRGSSFEPMPYITPSPFPSLPESSSKSSPKKKRKSGLRNVFRKMFGRRSRERPHEGQQQEANPRRHGYHHSVSLSVDAKIVNVDDIQDPGILTQHAEVPKDNASGPRISDLPVRELQPINPLGQHLPFPMNVNAPQEASPPHEYLTFEVPERVARRRASLPSVILSDAQVQTLAATLEGSGKHAISWDERRDVESLSSPLSSPPIGLAISSPPAPQLGHPKRRSRSAGALRDWAKSRPSTERRRSAEIRYWRNSYQSGSIYSQNTPRPRTAQTVETVLSANTHDTIARAPDSVAESSTANSDAIVAQHDQDISEIQLPVEAFNFGNLKSEFSDDEAHHEEPETVPEESIRASNRLSIEERVQHLETNVRTLESSVRRLSGRSNRQTIILENAPKGRRSRNRSSSATSDRQGSHRSSKSSNKTLSVKNESPTLAPLSAVDEFPSSQDRPQTVIALEASPDPRQFESQSSDLVEQFAAVYAALKHERASRKALEKQVYSLQREITNLHNLFNKIMTASPSYPTPSPDGIITSNEERLATPRASRRPNHDPDFEADDTENAPPTARKDRETIVSRFSQSDSEGGDEGNYSLSSSMEDVTSPEAWATPKEESGFGSGFFSRAIVDEKKGAGDDEMF
ncbi:hypothetical protein CC78DRAFT_564487 [Lojkania enalia]|uniref:Uncharacterized protein n=1 Tax=Lojkania enalia TaxID=147567 RepID=A0A9P4TPV7_9PLEO|nr:hypothetical protein CC78DRAFT_564487 [Didymosphaeria enalia]